MNKMKIGLFDSGMGGLSILQVLLKKYPDNNFIYFADTLNLPYGNKSKETINQHCTKIKDFLLSLDVDLLLITCNSASCLYIDKKNYKNTPLLNVISPTIKKLMKISSENNRVGILATPFTVQSNVYPLQIQSLKPQLEVFQESAPNLASLVEGGRAKASECRESLKKHLEFLLKKNIDILVLGCTHYFFLKDQIREIIHPHIKIVDLANDLDEEDFQNKIQGQKNPEDIKKIIPPRHSKEENPRSVQNFTEQMCSENIKERKSDSKIQIYMTQEQPVLEKTAKQIVQNLQITAPPQIKILNPLKTQKRLFNLC